MSRWGWDLEDARRRERRRRIVLMVVAWAIVLAVSVALWFVAIAGTLFVLGVWP